MFKINSYYTRRQIHAQLGGSVQSFLPTVPDGNHGCRVVAICLTLDKNPDAPHVILCGKGKIRESSSRQLIAQKGDPLPVFIKDNINHWLFKGYFKVKSSHKEGAYFNKAIANSDRDPAKVARVVRLIEA